MTKQERTAGTATESETADRTLERRRAEAGAAQIDADLQVHGYALNEDQRDEMECRRDLLLKKAADLKAEEQRVEREEAGRKT